MILLITCLIPSLKTKRGNDDKKVFTWPAHCAESIGFVGSTLAGWGAPFCQDNEYSFLAWKLDLVCGCYQEDKLKCRRVSV